MIFSHNRVKKSIELLQKHDLIVNDLSLFKNDSVFESKYLSNRIKNNSKVEINFIYDKNIFGFSNTAINTKKLKNIF